MAAPAWLTDRVELILAARRQVERDLREEEEQNQKAAERDARLHKELYGY